MLRFYMEGIGVVVYTAAENEIRTHASRELFLADYIYTPDPWEGRLGSLGQNHRRRQYKTKKTAVSCLFRFVSGKRDSVHLLPTLYIKQLPLPSTILPIRGTLGLFQGVVFRSDFCHTNFRSTVAYDKFTNNF